MAFDKLRNVVIKGIAAAVPDTIITSETYVDKIGKDAVQKFVDTVGIKQRHVGDGEITTADLCTVAANALFQKFHVERNSIDAVLFVTQTPDYIAPSTACILQHRLGLSTECLAYDINLCCSGYVYGLHAAMAQMQSGYIKRLLLLVGDTASYTVSPEDSGVMMLFGDAGTATLLETSTDKAELQTPFYLKTFGEGFRNLMIPYGGYRRFAGSHERRQRKDGTIRSDYDCYMNGPEVFKFSITEVPKAIRSFYEYTQMNGESFDLAVFHQANQFIIKNIAKRMKLPAEKLAFSMDEYGNTGSATIPLTLCKRYGEDNDAERKTVLIAGFGIGLSLGVAGIYIAPQYCLSIIKVGKEVCFEDKIDEIIE